MNKIIAALVAALAWVLGAKETTASLKQQIEERDKAIAERDTQIEDLLKAIEDDKVDDAALQAAATEARAAQTTAEAQREQLATELADLNAQLETATSKADELAANITADPAIPVEVTPAGEVVSNAAPEPKPPLGSV